MKELQNNIKNKNFKNVYLLFGEERYLVQLYEHKLRKAIIEPDMEMMNLDIFEDKDISVVPIVDAISTLPFMQDYRLVIVRDSGLFMPGHKDESEKMAEALSDISPSSIIIFNEPQVDKRNKLYKKVVERGRAVEFKTPSEKELSDWIVRNFKQGGKRISGQAVSFLLKTLARDMQLIAGECEKLIAYKSGEQEILESDIELVCVKTLETKIFDMIGAICSKNSDTALDIFANLMQAKESPIMVISMMARQFRLILQSKHMLQRGSAPDEIAATLGQRSFVIRECIKQAKNFTEDELIMALRDCLDADVNIKTGKMGDRLAVEMLIIKYSILGVSA